MIVDRKRRPRRPNCDLSDVLWQLIAECWSHDANTRPNASSIVSRLDVIRSSSSTGDIFSPLHAEAPTVGLSRSKLDYTDESPSFTQIPSISSFDSSPSHVKVITNYFIYCVSAECDSKIGSSTSEDGFTPITSGSEHEGQIRPHNVNENKAPRSPRIMSLESSSSDGMCPITDQDIIIA